MVKHQGLVLLSPIHPNLNAREAGHPETPMDIYQKIQESLLSTVKDEQWWPCRRDGLAGQTPDNPPSPTPTQHRGKIMDLAPLALHSVQHWGHESGPDYCPGLPVTRRLWRLCVWQGPGHHLSNKAASRQWQNWATRFKQEAESQSKRSIKNDEELGKSQSEWEKTIDTNNEMRETRSNKDFKATDNKYFKEQLWTCFKKWESRDSWQKKKKDIKKKQIEISEMKNTITERNKQNHGSSLITEWRWKEKIQRE